MKNFKYIKDRKITKKGLAKAQIIWDGLKPDNFPLKNLITFETYMVAFELWLKTNPSDFTEVAFGKWFDVNYPNVRQELDILHAVDRMQKKQTQILKRQLNYAERTPELDLERRKKFPHEAQVLGYMQKVKNMKEYGMGGVLPRSPVIPIKSSNSMLKEERFGIRKSDVPQFAKNGALDLYMRETKEGIKANIKALAKRLESTPFRKWNAVDLVKVQQYPELLEALLKEQRKKGHY